jgi:hypothetical protein
MKLVSFLNGNWKKFHEFYCVVILEKKRVEMGIIGKDGDLIEICSRRYKDDTVCRETDIKKMLEDGFKHAELNGFEWTEFKNFIILVEEFSEGKKLSESTAKIFTSMFNKNLSSDNKFFFIEKWSGIQNGVRFLESHHLNDARKIYVTNCIPVSDNLDVRGSNIFIMGGTFTVLNNNSSCVNVFQIPHPEELPYFGAITLSINDNVNSI